MFLDILVYGGVIVYVHVLGSLLESTDTNLVVCLTRVEHGHLVDTRMTHVGHTSVCV